VGRRVGVAGDGGAAAADILQELEDHLGISLDTTQLLHQMDASREPQFQLGTREG